MTSQIFVVSLLLFLTNGKLTTAVDSCCNETKSLLLTMVNAINDLNKKVDRLTSCQEERDLKDCSDVRASGRTVSGVYRINIGNIPNRIAVDVFCDLKSPNRSWLVFQRRQDGSEIFERTWNEYANGFGILTREFWLGNNALYLLTSARNYKLRVELEDFEGQKRFAEYSTFSIASPSDNYRLAISGYYSGDAGDSLGPHNGYQFSTKDADHDVSDASCAQLSHGAWWYSSCHASNLNGLYLRGNHTSFADGIEWYTFHGQYYSLKATEMKISFS